MLPKISTCHRCYELLLGHSANAVIVYGFDYVLYPAAIYWLGVLWGGTIMMLASFTICLLTLWAYDWSGRDWLGIEAIKAHKEYTGSSRAGRWLAWVLARGDWLAFLALSLKFDPFVVTVYLRHRAYNGMSRRDWRHFLASWLIGNVYWVSVAFGGVSAFRWMREVFWP